MTKKTLLLTGATGFFGSRINKKLKKKYKILSPSSKKLNLLSRKSISKYLEKNKIDIIVNSAWKINSTIDSKKVRINNYKKNINMAKNLTTISRDYSIKYFLNISSINVYEPQNYKLFEKNLLKSKKNQSRKPEGKSKLFLIKQFNKISYRKFKYKNLLFSNIYGFNRDTKNPLLVDKIFHNLYLNKKYIISFPIKNKLIIDYIFINDAVIAVDFFLQKLIKDKFKHPFVNIGSGKGYKIEQIFNLIDKKKKIKKNYFEYKNKKYLLTSINLAKKYGWKPKYSLIQGIKITTQKYRNINSKI